MKKKMVSILTAEKIQSQEKKSKILQRKWDVILGEMPLKTL